MLLWKIKLVPDSAVGTLKCTAPQLFLVPCAYLLPRSDDCKGSGVFCCTSSRPGIASAVYRYCFSVLVYKVLLTTGILCICVGVFHFVSASIWRLVGGAPVVLTSLRLLNVLLGSISQVIVFSLSCRCFRLTPAHSQEVHQCCLLKS